MAGNGINCYPGCQFGISNGDKMGLRYKPMAFTKQGVAMFTPLNAQPVELGLSSVLKSKRAVQVNIHPVKSIFAACA